MAADMSNHINTISMELPPRKWSRSPSTVAAMTRSRGGDDAAVVNNARVHSNAEWCEDLGWLESERDRLSLSDADCDGIKEMFRKRNVDIWGSNSWTPD